MATFTIRGNNWTDHLADAIKSANDGDTIEVANDSIKELGENAKGRMCPNKKLIFKVKAPAKRVGEYNDYFSGGAK